MTITLGRARRSSVAPIGASSSALVLGSMAVPGSLAIAVLAFRSDTCICTYMLGTRACTSVHMHLHGMGAMQKTPESETADAPDIAACNCLAIRQAARQITQLYERHMAAVGLTASQYSILAKLARLGPLSINTLAAEMVMDRTTTGRAIRPLERDRLVAVESGSDARTKLVRLTPAGTKRFKAAVAHWREAQREFERAFGAEESAALRAALARASALA